MNELNFADQPIALGQTVADPLVAGSVTAVSVATANGVSGSVATPNTTPVITLALGAITPTSVASTGAVTGTNLSGTNTGDQTNVSGNAGTATALATSRNFSLSGGGVTSAVVAFNGGADVVLVPVMGAITPTSVASAGAITSSGPTSGVGYAAGAGGTVTQATSKATGVTLNKAAGQITMNNGALAASTSVGFVLTNSALSGGTDVLVVNIKGGAASSLSYRVDVTQLAGNQAVIVLANVSAGSLSEAVILQFAVIKGANT